MKWAFVTANYVARARGYAGDHDWGAHHQATVAQFQGATFGTHFAAILDDIVSAGYADLEIWVAHLDPLTVDNACVAEAQRLIAARELDVVSFAAGFSRPGLAEAEGTRIMDVARALGAPVLAQMIHPSNRELAARLAERYGIHVGHENHPEPTPHDAIEHIKAYAPWLGVTLDTGWFATQGYEPARAVYELRDYLLHVHLKDIRAAGGHATCTLGDGVADIPGVLAALKQIGWERPIAIEHEPYDYDPTSECAESLARARRWWGE